MVIIEIFKNIDARIWTDQPTGRSRLIKQTPNYTNTVTRREKYRALRRYQVTLKYSNLSRAADVKKTYRINMRRKLLNNNHANLTTTII